MTAPKSPAAAKSVRTGHTVSAPTKPMTVAREVVDALYMTPHGPSLRYHRGLPHRWDGTCWPEIATRDVRSAVYHFLENAQYTHPDSGLLPWAPTRRKLDDVMDALQAVTLVESRLEPPLWISRGTANSRADEIVSMQNGLLHVPSRALLPHTSRFFVHHSLPFAFLPDAPPPRRWLALMCQLWPDDEASIGCLQEVMGYLLAGGTSLQKIVLIVGPKRAGKGTIARVLTGLLGVHNVAAPTLSSLSTNFGLSPLIGKPLAVVADARLSPRTESHVVVERLLSISGEDSLTVDRKYREPWTGRLPTRFLILTNELPRLTDCSGALASRFIALVMTKSFYGSENTGLTEELLAEAPSIFVWALTGLNRLHERGHFDQPAAGREALQRLDELASPIRAFVRARCIVSATARVAVDAIWSAWRGWCELENRHPGTRAIFGRDLNSAVPAVHRVRARDGEERHYDYAGIGLIAVGSDSATHLGPLGPATGGGLGGPRSQPMLLLPGDELEVDDERF